MGLPHGGRLMARRSDHSREEIKTMAIQAAHQIVEREGLVALTTRKVANAIGYTVGTLYHVFQNQDELIVHVNAATLDDLYKQLSESATHCRKPESCVLILGHEYVRFAYQHRNLWSSVFEHSLPAGDETPEWFRARVTKLFGLIEAALENITGNQRIDTQLASNALWSGVHGICVLGITGKLEHADEKNINVLVDSLIRNYLAGLSAPKK